MALDNERRLYQDIASKLAHKINSGRLADGELLASERELAHQFGVSRATVREALLSLQASGLISMRPKTRARVTSFKSPAFVNQLSGAAKTLLATPSGITDFQEARALFECGLARHAARHASPKEVERLARALERNRRAIGDPELFARTDLEFHSVLAEIPGNPIFVALNAALADWLLAQRTIGIRAPIRGVIRRAYRDHEQVYLAIAAHDPEAAEKAMAVHMKAVIETYWKATASSKK